MLNALGIDIEEWYHIAGTKYPAGLSDTLESRIVKNTERVLDFLQVMQTQATFFVLGVIAERYPGLVRRMDAQGHEVASHGYQFLEVFKHTPESFREDIRKSMDILSALTNKPVLGYRAPNFSIVKNCLWALGILEEVGIKYDSSIYPVLHPRYGIPNAPRVQYHVRQELIEFPPSTVRFLGDNYPVAGGLYLRLLSIQQTKKAIDQLNSQNIAVNAYIRCWEMDEESPKPKVPWSYRFFRSLYLDRTQDRLEKLLTELQFVPLSQIVLSKK
ncbi:MAG: DUF3473 domain-containing protein [Candidatus Omnitrophota bacterium]